MWYKKFNLPRQLRKNTDLLTTYLATLLLSITLCNPLYSCSNDQKNIEVCFTPGGGCIQLIEKAVSQAQKQILVQAYYFTSFTIAQALIEAHKKGVIVKILVDSSQLTQRGSQLKRLFKSGVVILIDKVPGLAHNKVMIIDDWYVLTGSYNWTKGAEHANAENLILITDKDTNQAYKQNWERRAQQARAISLADIGKRAR